MNLIDYCYTKMAAHHHIDCIELMILFMADGKETVQEASQVLHLSGPEVQKRIAELERKGYINCSKEKIQLSGKGRRFMKLLAPEMDEMERLMLDYMNG